MKGATGNSPACNETCTEEKKEDPCARVRQGSRVWKRWNRNGCCPFSAPAPTDLVIVTPGGTFHTRFWASISAGALPQGQWCSLNNNVLVYKQHVIKPLQGLHAKPKEAMARCSTKSEKRHEKNCCSCLARVWWTWRFFSFWEWRRRISGQLWICLVCLYPYTSALPLKDLRGFSPKSVQP